jgi:predicted aconitase with swiveling domain
MKVEMKRSRLYGGVTLEAGRVADVEEAFGRWLITKGFAVPYSNAVTIPNVREMVKRGRPPKGN